MDEKKENPEKDNGLHLKRIARIRNDFPTKFGIPRQSGLVAELVAKIVFEPEYRRKEALEGLEGYSHIWLIWEFSESIRENWSATVRPPRLGGNVRRGVFATRSPFRPNPIGLSCVRLCRVEISEEDGPVLYVAGADLMDKTPVFDIKPYLPYVDAHPEAEEGFAAERKNYRLEVSFSDKCREEFSADELSVLKEVLSQDPRPSYQNDPERAYGMSYAGREVKFRVEDGTVFVSGAAAIGGSEGRE